jgi:hypothetical protein
MVLNFFGYTYKAGMRHFHHCDHFNKWLMILFLVIKQVMLHAFSMDGTLHPFDNSAKCTVTDRFAF